MTANGRTGPFRTFAAEGRQALVDRIAEALARGLAPAGAERLKENALRTVWRLPGERVVVKIHRPRGLLGFAKSLLRTSAAAAEWRVGRALRGKGLPTAEPLGYGEETGEFRSRRSFGVFREIEGATTLERHLEAVAGEDRRRALERLGAFVAALHGAGADPRDLHARDLLVVPGAPATLAIVDLHAVRLRRALAPRRRARTLALALRALRRSGLGPEERDAVFHGYATAAGVSEDLLRLVDAEGERLERVWRRSRIRRCFRDSPEFAVERAEGGRVCRRRDAPEGGPFEVEGLPSGGAGPIARWLRRDPGRRRWRAARALEVCGVPAPRYLAFHEARSGREGRRSFLLREKLPDAVPFAEFVAVRFRTLPQAEKRRLLRATGRLLGTLDERGFGLRRVGAANFLVRTSKGEFELLPIALEDYRARHRRSRDAADQAVALAEVLFGTLSRPDRLRFARAFEAAAGPGAP